MKLYRLAKARHATNPLDGEGGRIHGGRWNSPGLRAVYASPTLSLALIETLSRFDWSNLPDDYVAILFELPDDVSAGRVDVAELPPSWEHDPLDITWSRARGDAWLRTRREVALWVPSVFCPAEANVVLNPEHPDISRASIIRTTPYRFDSRFRR